MAKVALAMELGRPCLRRSVDPEVADTMCNRKLLHLSKELCTSSPLLNKIDELDRKALEAIDQHCIPELQGTARILNHTEQPKIESLLLDLAEQRASLVRAFLDRYPQLIEADKAQMKDLFEADEYPLASELETQFTLSWRFIGI